MDLQIGRVSGLFFGPQDTIPERQVILSMTAAILENLFANFILLIPPFFDYSLMPPNEMLDIITLLNIPNKTIGGIADQDIRGVQKVHLSLPAPPLN